MKKIISTILATALMCSAATTIPVSAAKDNKGNYHNYIRVAYYGTDDPSDETSSYKAEKIKERQVIGSDGECKGALKCYYNDNLIGYDRSKAEIAGQSAGFYYDCYVVEVGKKTARSSTTRGKGNATKWMNDSNDSTYWYGNVYWD